MELLELGFMQRAFVACLAVCAVAPLVGTFVVQRKQSLIGDGLGHVAFAGVGAAYLFGVEPLLGALSLGIAGAVLLARRGRARLEGDASLALVFYGGIALGFAFLSGSGMGVNQVLGLLFGSPLNLTWGQTGAIVALSATVLLIVVLLYGQLLALAFDEAAAKVSGVRTNALSVCLTCVVALIIVGGMYAIGILLVAAMLVVPVIAASQLTSSYASTMVVAGGIGAFSAVTGLVAAYYVDQAPGASIVLVAIGCYLLTSGIRAVRGA